uniref:Uncharacterized protein n=1 Tax=Arundo donax TaxID=35708 RepID=A0A0A9E2P0_ARUDO
MHMCPPSLVPLDPAGSSPNQTGQGRISRFCCGTGLQAGDAPDATQMISFTSSGRGSELRAQSWWMTIARVLPP